jgi:hypothetical protein
MIDHGQTLRGPAPDAIADSKVKTAAAGWDFLFIYFLIDDYPKFFGKKKSLNLEDKGNRHIYYI